jgi:hypothetical protein
MLYYTELQFCILHLTRMIVPETELLPDATWCLKMRLHEIKLHELNKDKTHVHQLF